jgi:hypothetical protein
MSRKTTTHKKPRMVQALAALVLALGAGLIGAAPARADHGPDVGFSFSFGFPVPFFPVPVPVYAPPVRYAPPAVVYERPVVVYERPVYYAPRVYYKHPHGNAHGYWRNHDRDDRWERNRSDYRDARW